MITAIQRLRWSLFGAAGAALIFVTTTALAGSGIGDVFNLGLTNSVDATSTLAGTTAGPQLLVTNANASSHAIRADSGGGTGVALYGLHTTATGSGAAVKGETKSAAASAFGVHGLVTADVPAANAAGVRGEMKKNVFGAGVWGSAPAAVGVRGDTTSGTAVEGVAKTGIAGSFTGNVRVVKGRFATETVSTFPNGATTPDVSHGNIFIVKNGSPTTITDFVGGVEGQRLTIFFETANTTIDNGPEGSPISFGGGNDLQPPRHTILELIRIGGAWWGIAATGNPG